MSRVLEWLGLSGHEDLSPEDITLDEQVIRGEGAQKLLDDKVVKQVFAQLREETMRSWPDSGISDVEFREDCFKMIFAIRRFEEILKRWAETGKAARQELNERSKAA